MEKCCQIIRAPGRKRARLFAEGLLGDVFLLKRLSRYWLRVVANSPGISNLEACHNLIESVWLCKPDFGLEASRDGSRHSVVLYPFGVIGEDANRYLRVPLRFLSPSMKQAVQCFLSYHEVATDFYEPITGMFMAETFAFNDELRRALDRYRELMVVCMLQTIAGVAVSWDRSNGVHMIQERVVRSFVSSRPVLGPKTLVAWNLALKKDGIESVCDAIERYRSKKNAKSPRPMPKHNILYIQ